MKRPVFMVLAAVVFLVSPCTEEEKDVSVQARLRAEFASDSYVASYRAKRLAPQGPFARLIIHKLGIDLIVAEGTTGESLRAGAGHYLQTSFPGEVGNAAIAGVRDGDPGPFRRLNEMAEGDEVILIVPGNRFTYRVTPPFGGHGNPWVTTPDDLSTLAPTEYAALTLTTSDPPETPTNRLILRLRLIGSEPASG